MRRWGARGLPIWMPSANIERCLPGGRSHSCADGGRVVRRGGVCAERGQDRHTASPWRLAADPMVTTGHDHVTTGFSSFYIFLAVDIQSSVMASVAKAQRKCHGG